MNVLEMLDAEIAKCAPDSYYRKFLSELREEYVKEIMEK